MLCKWAGYFVRRTLRNERGDGTALVLEGPTGTGKTTVGRFCARAFRDYALESTLHEFIPGHEKTETNRCRWYKRSPIPSVAFVDWSSYCRKVDRKETGPHVIDEALQCQVIILDDVGAEADQFKSGSHTAELRDFLEECANKWLLVSMNIARAQWRKAFGERVASRLSASRSFDTTGIPDFRLTQGTRTL